MNLDSRTIERIVAEVVRRLSQMAGSSTAADAPPALKAAAPPSSAALPSPAPSSAAPSSAALPSPALPTPAPSPSPDTLALDARVITTATIHGRLKGIRRVITEQRAVITPSVRDELRKRNIRLERQESSGSDDNSGDLTIVRCTRDGDAVRATAALPLPARAVERSVDDLSAAVTCAATTVRGSERVAVLMTDEPLAAACLLNRDSAVRAVYARSVDELRQAIAAIGVNVLVIDPRDMTVNQWQVAVKVFRSGLPRVCPSRLNCRAADVEGIR